MREIRFETFRLDLADERLWRGTEVVPLTPKAFGVLRYLAERPNRLVTKQELLDGLWPGTVVGEGVLKSCVNEIRRALGETARAPRCVQTVHRRGYRFIGTSRGEDAQRPSTPLVGRTAALDTLAAALDESAAGRRRVLFVNGEPGIGKTALVSAFIEHARRHRGARVGWGQCLEHYGPGQAYLPVLDALSRLCRDPDAGEIAARLASLAPSWRADIPALAPRGADVARGAQPRERALLELAEAIEALAVDSPLVLVFEDLHWSDYSTLDALSLLARRPEPARLVILATYRPAEVVVRAHPLGSVARELEQRGLAAVVELELLSQTEVGGYLAARLSTAAIDPELAGLVHRRTDGNPLFMVSLVDFLLARGLLVEQDGTWTLHADVGALAEALPENLRQAIERQLEAATEEERRLLEAASVSGDEFSAAWAAAAVDAPLGDAEDLCDGLARRHGFIRAEDVETLPDGTRATRYAFVHSLYRDVLYRRLPSVRRAELHRRTADRMETAHEPRSAEVAAALAVHREQAGDWELAIARRREAAETSARHGAYHEAVLHLERGLELLPRISGGGTEQELLLQTALGPILMMARGVAVPAVERCQARARLLCRDLGAGPQLFQALRGLCIFALARADYETARHLAGQCFALAEQVDDPPLWLRAHMMRGMAAYYLGDLVVARDHFERAVGWSDPTRRRPHGALPVPEVTSLSYLAHVLWLLGYPDQALERCRESQQLAEAIAHPDSIVWAQHFACELHLFRGERDAAIRAGDAAIRQAVEHGFAQFVAWGEFFQGWLAVTDGDGTGLARMERGAEDYVGSGGEVGRTQLAAALAEGHLALGRAAEARRVLADALEIAARRGERYCEPELDRLMGEAHVSSAGGGAVRPAEAEPHFRRAIDVARRTSARSLELRAAVALARLLIAHGRADEARRLLVPLCGWFTEGARTTDLRAARALLAE